MLVFIIENIFKRNHNQPCYLNLFVAVCPIFILRVWIFKKEGFIYMYFLIVVQLH